MVFKEILESHSNRLWIMNAFTCRTITFIFKHFDPPPNLRCVESVVKYGWHLPVELLHSSLNILIPRRNRIQL